MKIIAISNQKGGCGKTTTSVNLAVALAQLDKRVLLIDLDAQAHATLGLGVDPDEMDRTVYDILINPWLDISIATVATDVPGLDIVPSNILLSGAESKLTNRPNREGVLKQVLVRLRHEYDYCIIDCLPSLSILTLNALVAATDVLIPVQMHYYALEGLKQLLETVDIVKQKYNPSLDILGVLLTFAESRTLLCKQVEKQMRGYFGELVFDTVIRRTIRLAEAPSNGESVMTYDPKCNGAQDYRALANEICYEAKSGIAQKNIVDL